MTCHQPVRNTGRARIRPGSGRSADQGRAGQPGTADNHIRHLMPRGTPTGSSVLGVARTREGTVRHATGARALAAPVVPFAWLGCTGRGAGLMVRA